MRRAHLLTAGSHCYILFGNTSDESLRGVNKDNIWKLGEIPTMKVVVITLAIPNPWGIRSLQRCNCDELSFHIATMVLA
jgi:hypothetical protein